MSVSSFQHSRLSSFVKLECQSGTDMRSYRSSYGNTNSQFLPYDITTNIRKNKTLINLFHSLWDKHKFSEERKKIKEMLQLKRFIHMCKLSKRDTFAVYSLDSSRVTNALLMLLLTKKGSNYFIVNTQCTIHPWGLPQM
ncbi:hypothetical protein DPMN_006093 [Dreissena polymorpha]|uniref:Uncharacterized protein n=1 Tax=Dreissena polymorpha TaxID=45954 RepID=A0A9D4MVV3_DREPO|nr:hypothetical protein DPMN_006093 [Dreissena polymorpha]